MTATSRAFYDRFARVYPIIDIFLKPQKVKLFKLLSSYPPGQLLEIGTGNGAHFKYYDTHQVVAIDTSASMLHEARKHQTPNITILQMDGENLDMPDNTFDYVLLSHVIAVVEKPNALLSEVFRVLKHGGKLVILNHITPKNPLRYIDIIFSHLSGFFHFKSVFDIRNLQQIKKFKLEREVNAGFFSYFKILVYEKSF